MAELTRPRGEHGDRSDTTGLFRRAIGGLGRLRAPENRRLAAVVAAAVITGGAAVVAIGDVEGADPGDQLASRIEAESPSPSPSPSAQAFGRDGATLPAPSSGADTTAGTVTASTTGNGVPTTDTSEVGSLAEDDDTESAASSSSTETTATTDGSTTSTSRATTMTQATTMTRPTTSTTSTTRATTSTTRATTSTTQATITTTRPTTTTTTQATTTTTQATTTTAGNSCASGAEFELIMRDDFNGSSIGGQWFVWNGSDGNAGNGKRYASQLSVSNGRLLLEAEMVDGTLHSGGMNHTHAQTYGKYRFRVRTDVDPSRTMSGVILTWPTSNDHLRDGENNAYETLPHESSATRDPFYSFIHKPFAANASQQEYKIWRADAAQWQTITMEWTPSRISVTRDGGETWTVNETGADLVPDVNHRFHIQLDAFGPSISNRVTMEVDFAEVYRYCG